MQKKVKKAVPTAKKLKWVTKEMVESSDREFFLLATIRETIIFSIFLTNLTFIALGMVYPSMYFLTQMLRGEFTDSVFMIGNIRIRFPQIRSAGDFWAYAETNFIEAMYWDYYYDERDPVQQTEPHDKSILYENKLLGVPRIRQVKVRNDSCQIHPYFRRTFLVCYDSYSSWSLDKETFGLGLGTAWTYTSPSQSTSSTHYGKIGVYDGGGYFQKLSAKSNETLYILKYLKQNLWITRGTRVVFIDFTVYNANVNLFCAAKLVFEFPPTGGIIPTAYFHTVKLLRYVTALDHAILGCEFIHFCFILYYSAEELREVIYLKWRYFALFWSYIDTLIIVTSYAYYGMSIVKFFKVDAILKNVINNPDEYFSFYTICRTELDIKNLLAVMLFLVYMKIFKYLNFNKTMGQLNNTLKRCAKDVSGFSMMFLLIFISFAELGYLIFGTQVKEFSTFGIAMFTLLRTILGDFDYTEIEKAHRILAPLYFLLFIFLVFFVLLNMFLAIINDTYADVKTELAIAPDEMQMTQFVKRGYYNFLSKCGCAKCIKPMKVSKNEYNLTSEEIRGALKKCGFSDLDVEMFFSRFNIDPEASINDFDINRLMQDLLGNQQYIPDEPTIKKKGEGPLVAMDDFVSQQEKLNHIEHLMTGIADKIDALIEKLESLKNVRKY